MAKEFDLGSIMGPTGPTGPTGDTGPMPFVSYVSTSDIDSVIANENPQGEQVQDLTGLSYFWSKIKSWAASAFAAITHTHQASDISGFTANKALVSDASGQPTTSNITDTELGYLSGVSEPIQTQLTSILSQLAKFAWDNVDNVQFVNANQAGYPGIAFTIKDGDQMFLYTTGTSLILKNRSTTKTVWQMTFNNVQSVMFMDVNRNACPGYTITTNDGRSIGIYAQEGLGFVLYDYTNQRRLGLCSFDS